MNYIALSVSIILLIIALISVIKVIALDKRVGIFIMVILSEFMVIFLSYKYPNLRELPICFLALVEIGFYILMCYVGFLCAESKKNKKKVAFILYFSPILIVYGYISSINISFNEFLNKCFKYNNDVFWNEYNNINIGIFTGCLINAVYRYFDRILNNQSQECVNEICANRDETINIKFNTIQDSLKIITDMLCEIERKTLSNSNDKVLENRYKSLMIEINKISAAINDSIIKSRDENDSDKSIEILKESINELKKMFIDSLEINHENEKTNNDILGTNNIIKELEEISLKFQLLSLNTVIEVGKHNYDKNGLVVISEEVRKLSDKNKKLIQELKNIIKK